MQQANADEKCLFGIQRTFRKRKQKEKKEQKKVRSSASTQWSAGSLKSKVVAIEASHSTCKPVSLILLLN